MQPRHTVGVLVLKSEGLVSVLIDAFIFFQTPPGGIFAVPQEIAVDVGLLARYTDLVAVEVVGLLSTPPLSLMWFRQAKPRTCVPHVPYVGIGGFVRDTVCYNLLTEYFMLEEEIPSSNYY